MTAIVLSLWFAAGCKSPPPTFEEAPPADELYAKGLETLEGGRFLRIIPWVNHGKVIETFQAIIDNHPYKRSTQCSRELEIADAYFDDGKYRGGVVLLPATTPHLHPQHPEVPYTIWRSALCQRKRKRPPNRDQTATRDAIAYLDRAVSGTAPDSEHAAEERGLLRRSLRRQLAENVVGIGNFYMKRAEYESAAERYRMLLNEYPGLGFDAATLYKLGVCYWKMNRKDEAEHIFRSIIREIEATNKRPRPRSTWRPEIDRRCN